MLPAALKNRPYPQRFSELQTSFANTNIANVSVRQTCWLMLSVRQRLRSTSHGIGRGIHDVNHLNIRTLAPLPWQDGTKGRRHCTQIIQINLPEITWLRSPSS